MQAKDGVVRYKRKAMLNYFDGTLKVQEGEQGCHWRRGYR